MKNIYKLSLLVLTLVLIVSTAYAQPHKGDWLIDGKASMGTGGFNYIRPFDLIKFSVIPNGTYFITNRLAATVTRASHKLS